ncbi:uncharacterized protein [Aquarana catesbeiana]|uniref:uncharacterized protein isoform X1 n=1 Tax=Aquarana catesbeiana TaxID=8400 RepID=UPI003CC9A0E3
MTLREQYKPNEERKGKRAQGRRCGVVGVVGVVGGGEWRSSEISADLRRKVVEVYQSGQGYTTISKALDLNGTTVRAILTKWKKFGTVVNLPRSGRPAKISPQARRIIISEVKKNPSAWSRELQASLASAQVNVQDSTIRKTLCKNGRVVSRKPLFPKRNMAACQECSGNLQNISSLEGRSVPPRIKSPLCSEKEEYLSSLLSEYQEKDEVEQQRALCAKACRRSSKATYCFISS